MSRSSWKFINFTPLDVEVYYKRFLLKQPLYAQVLHQRNNRLNFFNYEHKFSVHHGKTYSFFQSDEAIFIIGLKLGSLFRTRKPFFFRAKDKR